MRKQIVAAPILALALGACASGSPEPEAPSPANTELGYAMPAVNPLVYTSSDSMTFNILMAPGQSMTQTIGARSRVRMQFAPVTGTRNLGVTAEFVDFSGFSENSMTGRQEVGPDAMTGTFRLALTPTGDVDVVEAPDPSAELVQMNMGGEQFNEFFVRLPNEVVTPGATWTDTIASVDSMETGVSRNRTIVTATLRGDTIVGGRTVWIIEAQKNSEVTVEGETQGMTMRNELTGNAVETVWWDPVRRIMVASVSSGTMSGTFSLPAAGMDDIPMSASMSRQVMLVEQGD